MNWQEDHFDGHDFQLQKKRGRFRPLPFDAERDRARRARRRRRVARVIYAVLALATAWALLGGLF